MKYTLRLPRSNYKGSKEENPPKTQYNKPEVRTATVLVLKQRGSDLPRWDLLDFLEALRQHTRLHVTAR